MNYHLNMIIQYKKKLKREIKILNLRVPRYYIRYIRNYNIQHYFASKNILVSGICDLHDTNNVLMASDIVAIMCLQLE